MARLTSSWKRLAVQIITPKLSDGVTMGNTSHLQKGTPLTSSRLLAICHQNSISETPTANIRGLIVKPKIVFNKNKHMKKSIILLMALTMCFAVNAQEIEKIDKFASGYINGTYMNKYKTIDGVLYAVGYEGTKDWILVRYPAGSRNTTYNVHTNCRRIARGAFEGAAYLREIYLPETVSFIGEDAFIGCTSLQGIYFGESSPSAVRGIEANESNKDAAEEVARYNLSGHPCSPNEKGVQIIVYSDFSAQTVIVD